MIYRAAIGDSSSWKHGDCARLPHFEVFLGMEAVVPDTKLGSLGESR